jgi:cytochrome c oxidase subunit II
MDWMKEASTSAQKSDAVFFVVLGLSVAVLILITAVMIFFVVRYSRKRNPRAEQIEGHAGLETLWTVTPLVIFLSIFYYGWTNFEYMRNAPRDAMVVKVTARQWAWSFEYPNGKQTAVLYAALDRPMKMEVRSLDVIHGFFIPAFRLKIDAVPGRPSTTWFEATRVGAYDIECTVICGVSHSTMLSRVVVVPEEEFKAWYFGDEGTPEPGRGLTTAGNAAPPDPNEPRGLSVMRTNDCLSCHSTDGKPMVGPTFRGLFGLKQEVVVQNAVQSVTVDDAFVRESILEPAAQIVKGYPPAMPQLKLEPKDLDAVVTYIEGLK